jgi:hypothetical protein
MQEENDIAPILLSIAKNNAAQSDEFNESAMTRLGLKELERNCTTIESTRNGFPIFSKSGNSKTMTLETVKDLLSNDNLPT